MTGGTTVDLLAVTPERIRRALKRSFLRYGITGELDAAVHAAMNVIGPVLEARDAEIMRLHEMLGRVKPPARSRASSARADDTVAAGVGPGGRQEPWRRGNATRRPAAAAPFPQVASPSQLSGARVTGQAASPGNRQSAG